MLPAALKAKYEKKVKLVFGHEGYMIYQNSFKNFFKNNDMITWEDALKNGACSYATKGSCERNLEVIYIVKGKT